MRSLKVLKREERQNTVYPVMDEYEFFGKLIATELKASSGRQKSVVQLRIQQILTDAEFQDESCYSDQHNNVNKY